MLTHNVTALSDLKIGDVFRFAELPEGKKDEGEKLRQWKVVSIGDPFCAAAVEKFSGPGANDFADGPVQFNRQTSVLKVSGTSP